ncbi:rhodanese-like domain-containing protein [Acidiplasma cupricumulans]|nr:rhodanese-like domain-containing protein [Acidiplasma cupricumulans]
MVYQIIPQELNEMLNNDDAVIIDVREPFEYEYGHIKILF